MTQLELEPVVRMPQRGSQHYEILIYLQSGGRLTVAKALTELGVYALSQRCGELRRMGWPVRSETVRVGPRCYVSEYFMAEA